MRHFICNFFFLCLYLLNSVFLNIVAIKRNSLFEELLKISRFDELCILKQKVNSTSYGPLVIQLVYLVYVKHKGLIALPIHSLDHIY